MLETLIHQLSQDLNIEEPAPLQVGHYKLAFADGVEVDLLQLPHSYLFKSSIGPAPDKNKEPFFAKLMEANLFSRGTRGSAIGLKPDGNILTLSFELSYNSSYKIFKEKLEDFVSVLEFWRSEAAKL